MKHTKRLLSTLLALVMVITMAIPAFADTKTAQQGVNVEITNARYNEEYNLYKIFDLTYSVVDNTESYSYTLAKDSKFYDLFVKAEGATTDPDGAKFIVYNATNGVVEASDYLKAENYANKYEFANTINAYIIANSIAADETKTVWKNGVDNTVLPEANERTSIVFDNAGNGLEMGYYFVDTEVAAVFMIDSNNIANTTGDTTTITITDKAPSVTVDKAVKEDSTNSWLGVDQFNSDLQANIPINTADINQVVEYKTTIDNVTKVKNLILHDTMDEGLTFLPESVKVYLGTETDGTLLTNGTEYELKTGEPHTETVNCDFDSCTFDIYFKDVFLASRSKEAVITVCYNAILNEKAKLATAETDNHNPNGTMVTYGAGQKSVVDYVTTKTWKIDILKYHWANVGEGRVLTEKPLNGAKFVLIRNNGTLANPIYELAKFHLSADGKLWLDENWVPATEDGDFQFRRTGTSDNYKYSLKLNENALADAIRISGEEGTGYEGEIHINGLDVGTYALMEIEAPPGFDVIPQPIVIQIRGDGYTTWGGTNTQSSNEAIKVLNETGARLPSTGGMGTTMFYIVGAILSVGALVLLVTKRRMSEE